MTTSYCILRSPVYNFLATVVLVASVILLFIGENRVVEADEFPTFYLKAAKSVPRIGRRSGTLEEYFLKAPKSVPRIGRRGYSPGSIKTTESWPWYPKTSADLPKSLGVDDSWSSEDYVHGMEQSPELWELITANGGDSATSAGINGEIWQREKRTGNEPSTV